ncbi:MAG TPA: retropepsin-like aspartic protease [Candidatus Acidoferrum sp.]|jgi:predicted aspartyl protease
MEPLPFKLNAGFLIVVEGSIGATNHLKFILDTGTTRTVVDRSLAAKLTTSSRRSGRIINFNRSVAVESVEVSDVKFGPIRVPRVLVFVADLGKISDFAVGADAIIGLDLISMSKIVRINYPSRTIYLQAASFGGEVPPVSNSRCFSVRATIQGQPLDLVVDTGIKGVLLYEDSIQRRLPTLRLENETPRVRIGRLVVKNPKLPGVVVGVTPLRSKVFLMGGHSLSLFDDVDGYLGTAALHAHFIEFNFEKQTLRWK